MSTLLEDDEATGNEFRTIDIFNEFRSLFNQKLATSLDIAKVSDRGAAVVVMPVLQRFGHYLTHYNISYSSIHRQ